MVLDHDLKLHSLDAHLKYSETNGAKPGKLIFPNEALPCDSVGKCLNKVNTKFKKLLTEQLRLASSISAEV